MKYLALFVVALLAACGVDGPPERPVVRPVLVQPTLVQPVVVADAPATYTDQSGIVRTTAKSVSAGTAAVGVTPADL